MDEIRRSRSFGSWLKRIASSPSPSSRKTSPFPRTIDKTESLDEDAVKHRRAGIVPLVVAKCGSYLKSQESASAALETEGIFRISGSMKRVNTLQRLFDDPNGSYGLHLNWVGYTVHDAASALRRYLNKMPEPVIPYHMYERFRDKHHRTTEQKVRAYQQLIQHLPIPHQHLLLYLLDLLSLFASHSSENKMDATNLAIVFAPGILNHPSQTSPVHCRIAQRVLEFLIEFQALFTMQLLSLTVRKQRLQEQQQQKEIPQPRSSPSTPTPTTSSSCYYQPQLAILSTSEKAQKDGDTIPPVPPLPSWLPTPDLHPPQPIHASASSSHLGRLAASKDIDNTSSNDNPPVISLHAPPRSSRSEPLLHQVADNSNNQSYPHERADSGTDVHTPTKDTFTNVTGASPVSGASTPRAVSPTPSDHITQGYPNYENAPHYVSEASPTSRDLLFGKGPKTSIAVSAIFASLGLSIFAVFGYELYQAAWAMQSLEPYVFLSGFVIYCTLLLRGIAWSENSLEDGQEDCEEEDDMDVISLLERNRDMDADDWPVDTTSEWRSLLMRQWRDDESVAGSISNRDNSDQFSILSTVSRFNEEADAFTKREGNSEKNSATETAEEEEEDNDDGWIDIDLQEIWRRQQQIQEDQALAQRMQQEEKNRAAAATAQNQARYGSARVMIPSARPSPLPARSRSTDRAREEWKISSRRQTWTSPPR
ncbi:hypothetical protein BCR43DRAFT_518480 [Syncephalastrum racemosum]|uniref:Rho-GAP domain-containing protein n=1 Tax=Syncephalastrum racemosum TaxID=13706 RepID=A0A1X2H0Y3_SYNRA|nr:hypothetical protein BCR43DRAFT_518480 [Syncephalastrum racemosum]